MRKLLVAVVIALAAAAVAGRTAPPAKAAGCAGDGTPYEEGYEHSGIPGVGGAFSADVQNVSSTVQGSSANENWMAGYVGASAQNGAFVWAGVMKDISTKFMGVTVAGLPTNGWVRFIAYRPAGGAIVLKLFDTAQNIQYPAIITHSGNATWTAKISTNQVQNIPVSFSGSTSASEFIVSTVNTTSTACNGMNFFYGSLAPWFITNPLTPITSGPYTDLRAGSDNDSFTATGGG